jgi:hypothetical protein
MEPEGSLPCPQEPSTGLYPVNTIPSYASMILNMN